MDDIFYHICYDSSGHLFPLLILAFLISPSPIQEFKNSHQYDVTEQEKWIDRYIDITTHLCVPYFTQSKTKKSQILHTYGSDLYEMIQQNISFACSSDMGSSAYLDFLHVILPLTSALNKNAHNYNKHM